MLTKSPFILLVQQSRHLHPKRLSRVCERLNRDVSFPLLSPQYKFCLHSFVQPSRLRQLPCQSKLSNILSNDSAHIHGWHQIRACIRVQRVLSFTLLGWRGHALGQFEVTMITYLGTVRLFGWSAIMHSKASIAMSASLGIALAIGTDMASAQSAPPPPHPKL